jgi:PAS domain S-box-containing protein
MLRTRVDEDLWTYYEALEEKAHLEEEDIQRLLDAYRKKFDADVVFAAEMQLDNSGTIFSHISYAKDEYNFKGNHYAIETGEGVRELVYDEEGLCEYSQKSEQDWKEHSVIHYKIMHNQEYDGIVGMVDFKSKRTWTVEERAAVQKLGRVLKYVLYVDKTDKKNMADQETIYKQGDALDTFFTTTDSGIMRHTIDGKKLLGINRAALEILGYSSQEEMMAEGFDLIADSVLEEDKERLRESIKKLKNIGDSVSIDYRVRHKDGEVRNVMGRVKLLEENGSLIYQRFLLDCTAQKLQEKKERMEDEKRFKEMIQALCIDFESVYFLDVDSAMGYPYRVNGDMIRRFGDAYQGQMQLKQSVDLYAANVVHEEDREMFCQATTREMFYQKLSRKPIYYLNYRTHREGVTEYFQMKAVRVGEWEQYHNAVVAFRNVDEEIRGELEQKSLLADALVQAEHASKAKTTFLSNMSHDIRTPMHAIIGFTTLAMAHAENTELVRDYLGKIMSSGNHLLSLINDVLDMSSIESGKTKLEEKECNLPTLIGDIQSILQTDIQAREQEFLVQIDELVNEDVICDELRLKRILINCLSNAVKFTNPGGKISLMLRQMSGAAYGIGRYEFKVKDTGIGMSKEFVEHIFEPFEREQTSTASGIQGTGLGMAITKNIVDMMNGIIQVESEEGKGTEFTIILEMKTVERVYKSPNSLHTEITQNNEHIEFAGKHILLAEDLELNQEIAEAILQEAGFIVTSVQNGQEAIDALERAKENTYDLILMDIQMPVMDGYEASRRIRKMRNPKKAEIPILAMTANAFEEDKRCAFEAGMDGHLTKPIQIAQLYKAIENQLRRKK